MRLPRLSPRAFRRLTLINLILLVAIIVSGAAVRLSDSGLGCSDWPRCSPEQFIDVTSSHHAAIEQLNRLLSGAIGIPIVLSLLAAYGRRPRRHDLVVLAWAMLAVFFGEAVLGGISVMVKLAWVSVMGHFLLAVALVALALVMHKRAGEPDGPRRLVVSQGVYRYTLLVYAFTIWVLVAGTLVTAAGPHGGDREARRLNWPIGDAARVHGFSVDVLIALVVILVVVLVRARAPRRVLNTCSAALLAMVAQAVLGYVQYAREIPPLLVGFHVFGAVLVFGTMQWLLLEMREVVPDAGDDPMTPPQREKWSRTTVPA
jgi:cytochrome c oxidase assembly protein subunit 15